MRPRDRERHPLQDEEFALVEQVVAALAKVPGGKGQATIDAIEHQLGSLALFGELLLRYPSPLQEQRLGGAKRDLDTLVDTLVVTDHATFPFRAPTQGLVGRAMNMAQINFLRMLWHVTGGLEDPAQAAAMRELAARRLRAAVHCRLVEEVLVDIVTDPAIDRRLRAQAVRNLAQLWGDRLTWRAHRFFPILAATWEARLCVRSIGGTLAGNAEILQLLTQGGDSEFVDLLVDQDYGEVELQAFREFLFDRSSEELERLARRMEVEGMSSIELDSKVGDSAPGAGARDAGSILFEFFRERVVACSARRTAKLAGPRHTAEGYVMLAWLGRQSA
ncbi:MAG: hypothetical protein FJ265_12400 [Planctomycetes bacterium]|nr:hypothetical protein [Planctomycetota bacterium]